MSKKLTRSALTFSAMTFISRILGFARDVTVAHIFGASGLTDAFFVAFKIPNFMRRLFAEGAFSQAFVPLLSEYKTKHTATDMKLFIDHVAGTLAGVLFIFTVVAILLAPWIIHLFSPGFGGSGMRFDMATTMLRITFPYIFFISLTAFAGGILNTEGHFAGPAITPVFLNIVMIIAAFMSATFFNPPILGLAVGVAVAGFVQWLFQFPFLKRYEVVPRYRWGWSDPGVKRLLKLMLPALFGVSVSQIGLLLTTIFASYLQEGSITWLYNSERLIEFPLGVFGVAISTVILPHLSKNHASESHEEYSRTLDWALRMVLLIGIPSALGLMLLAKPLMITFFNYGLYSRFDVIMSSESLMAYAIGVPCMMLLKILASAFYGKQNIKTPVKVAAITLAVTLLFNFIFIFSLKHVGLALAASLGATVNSVLLLIILLKKNIYIPQQGWKLFFTKLVGANGLLIIALLPTYVFSDMFFGYHALHRVLGLSFVIAGACIIYMGMLYLMKFRFHNLKGEI
jgi:putative peptidoglycan lipid II flippase